MEAPDLRKFFKNRVLNASDKLCKKRILQKVKSVWWWNVEVENAKATNKKAYKTSCKKRSENNLAKCKALKNKAKKMIARAMKNESEIGIEKP